MGRAVSITVGLVFWSCAPRLGCPHSMGGLGARGCRPAAPIPTARGLPLPPGTPVMEQRWGGRRRQGEE